MCYWAHEWIGQVIVQGSHNDRNSVLILLSCCWTQTCSLFCSLGSKCTECCCYPFLFAFILLTVYFVGISCTSRYMSLYHHSYVKREKAHSCQTWICRHCVELVCENGLGYLGTVIWIQSDSNFFVCVCSPFFYNCKRVWQWWKFRNCILSMVSKQKFGLDYAVSLMRHFTLLSFFSHLLFMMKCICSVCVWLCCKCCTWHKDPRSQWNFDALLFHPN